LSKLPTIGPKTATRLAFHLINQSREQALALADAIVLLKDRVRLCTRCYAVTEEDPCAICTAPERDQRTVCVVAEPRDIFTIERSRAYHGLYHVLGGVLSPMEGIGPSQLRIKEFIRRLSLEVLSEVIVATNPNAEGEATALYLSRLIAPSGITVSRLAYGLPIGGDLDYADDLTLARAMEGRRVL
jgi:recombination protein RecR